MDNLAKCAFLARQEGISYGQWMAKYGKNPFAKKKPVPKSKKNICPVCGTQFERSKGSNPRKYCSDSCRDKAYYRRKEENEQSENVRDE